MDLILIEKTCPFCGVKVGLYVREDDYAEWRCGALAQNAFPSPRYTVEDREFLISGLCEECQAKVFGDVIL